MRPTTTTILAAAAIAGLATTAAAQPSGERRGEGRQGRKGQAIVEYLGLTADQQEQWRALHERHREEMTPFREEGRELHQRLREAVEADEPDAAVGAAVKAVHAHREAMMAERQAFEVQLQSMLTEDQKVKFEAFKAARRMGRKGHRPGRGGRGGPGRSPGAESGWDEPVIEG